MLQRLIEQPGMRGILFLTLTAGTLHAAPMPRPRPVAVYLPLPPQMEAAIREHEQRLERDVKEEEKRVAEVMREEFDDGTVVRTPPYVRRKHFVETIHRYRIYLDPINGPKDFCGEPRTELLEKALRQRLEMYKMRLLQGIHDGTIAREDWVGPDRRPR